MSHEELFYFPNGEFLREAALGYDQAAASLTWLRTVQYYGLHKRTDLRFDMMFHLCDVVTDLDPRFEEPYIFGSFVLISEGEKPEEGVELLRKGLSENPESWRILFETGFVYYVFGENYGEAAKYFAQAAAVPGAPEQVSRFAAWVTYRAGELETAYLLWRELAEHSTNPTVREKAWEKVQELAAQIEESGT
jgi:hypothetical protein